MSKAITGGITVNLLAGILVTIVTICGTALWMADQHDRQAAAATQTMVSGGIDLTRRRLEAITNDYAWWDEAYDAYVRGDDEWLEANVGTGITGTQIADALVILDRDGKIRHAWSVDEAIYPPAAIFTPTVISWAARMMADTPVDRDAAQTLFTLGHDGLVHLVSVQRITPPTRIGEVSPADMPLIMFVQELTPERLSEIGGQYLLSDLRIVESPVPEGLESTSTLLTDPEGRSVGTLAWTAPHPGRELLRKVAIPIAGAVLLFALVAVFIALRARGMAMALSRSEEEAVIASRTDSLTGLLNRTGFTHRLHLRESLEACAGGRLAVIYIDVNEFKLVNDTLGHHAGDRLVVALARRLEAKMPRDAVFARIGGDEFGVLLTGEDLSTRIPALCLTFAAAIEEPFEVAGQKLQVHCAIGYAIAPGGATDPGEIVRRSDVAMYNAKAARERDGVMYDPKMELGAEEKRRIEVVLRDAIPAGELDISYQPILSTETRRVEHVEALVRWNSRELGKIGPDRFIPIAEQTGLIHEIGAFVLEKACRDIARWPGITACINISPVQLRDPTFIETVMRIVTALDVDPRRIELELTEGVLVAVPTIAKMRLDALKQAGFSIALDDFGTGFSSIGYLEQFPFDNLKIDKSFLAELGKSAKGNALVHSLVSLGQAMGLSVTAEGVETVHQFDLLRSIRCTRMQGWLIGRPMGADALTRTLASEDYYKGGTGGGVAQVLPEAAVGGRKPQVIS
jgi:diguanylate cyclase (GGDEF)-like protein